MDIKNIIGTIPMGGVYLFHIDCIKHWFMGPFVSEEKAKEWAEEHLCHENSCPGCGGLTPPPVGRHYGTLTK